MNQTKSDPYQFLLSRAIRYLSVQGRSVREMDVYLQEKANSHSIARNVVDSVLKRLQEMGYLDDTKFAQAFAAQSLHGKPKGPSAIRFELKKKGISEETIDRVMIQDDNLLDRNTQYELAAKSLGRKIEQYPKLPVLECKRKVYDYLLRRGFDAEVIRRLVDDLCKKSYNRSQETIE